ncbi:sugar phosphate isomerase/epimerase family protein [Solimonas terrae]|uniref:Sugar phosphate isomerase/epimerase n=1 Tax=Solimonas terrae TaxID=1396819 RepID=A0A6M2BMX6_9GAMM|nr:TIM barrel protein [Solimonas terrae]NGY04012.1 sugar phosphate isomerase/epimerase [Solimonas terrae]
MHERISAGETSFPGASLAELGDAWRTLAPSRISFVSPTLLDHDLAAVRKLIDAGGYRVETITHPFMPGQPLSHDEASWLAPRARLSRLIDIAQQIGARSIYLLSGGHGGLDWEDAAAAFCACIAPCATQARSAGIALAIEPASPLHADLHIAHSLRDTVQLAEMAGLDVCIDYFACWTEAGLRATIERAAARCAIVQVSDYAYGDRAYPCRAVPGDGAIPLRRLLEWTLAAGYDGAFDLELIGPRIDREGRVAAVARAAQVVGTMLHELGA